VKRPVTFILSLLGLILATAAAAAPAPPIGVWDVVAVNVDTTTARTQAFGVDDPRLVGRRITISEKAVDTNADEGGCVRPLFTDAGEPLPAAFARAFGTTQSGAPLRPADYALTLPETARGAFILIDCSPGLGGGSYANGAPFIATGGDTALLGWNDSAILTLRRRPADARPKPSFDCRHAATKPEKAICASVDLAAMDRSLAAAYGRALAFFNDVNPPQATRLRRDQRRWLAGRAACGSVSECLIQQYSQRISAIVELNGGV
jgi:uncharacterized protein YecT (DUF1311 family)